MLTMRFRCPSCGFAGQVRVPPHFARGRSARLRCGRCQNSFTLAVGRLWPQDSAGAYDALVPRSLDCAGERLGSLWVGVSGARGGAPPAPPRPPAARPAGAGGGGAGGPRGGPRGGGGGGGGALGGGRALGPAAA